MRLVLVFAALSTGLVPGLPGALEDAVHLFAEGHTLHDDHHDAAPSAEHESHDEGSGCEDCGHDGLCHCHGQTSIAPSFATILVAAPLAAQAVGEADLAMRPASRRGDTLDRPPRG